MSTRKLCKLMKSKSLCESASAGDRLVPTTRPWRRFLRVSVRGLIVLVLVTGAGVGWLVRSARIQREAVAAIRKAGGGVSYDSRWDRSASVSRSKVTLTLLCLLSVRLT